MPSHRWSVDSLLPAAQAATFGLMLAFASAIARGDDDAPKSIPVELQAAVTRAEFLGRQVYQHDRAAWLATDAMLADKRMRKLKRDVGGWITEPTAHGIRVVFISKDDTPVRLYEIEVDEREVLSEPAVQSTEPLTAEHLAQLRARALALSQSFMSCAKTYNAVSMPSVDGLRVYLMPAFSEHGVYPLGGYHLFETDSRGETLVRSRGFTNGCIEHQDAPKGMPEDARPAFGMFTHLLDPHPTEVHVFVSLYAKVPMMIMSVENKKIWSVREGKIAFVRNLD